MQRVIKFRLWDLSKKKYIPSDVFAVITNEFGAMATMTADWENYKEGEYCYPVSQTLQQFTGLLDKTGKEIYEGDIYETWYSRDTSGKDIVKFTEEVKWEEYDERCGYEIPFLRNAVVIGNRFENPELL
jgi:uncharacterized phage protein (TIGR01671 family)